MIFGIGNEAGMFLYAVLTGVTVLCAYDILVCVRRLVHHSMIAVAAEDMAFWLGASVYVFRRMYDATYGSIRLFFLAGMACGALLGYVVLRMVGKLLFSPRHS